MDSIVALTQFFIFFLEGGQKCPTFAFFELSPKLLTKLTWNFQSLIFRLFESCSKRMLKTVVRKALNPALSWMTSYQKKSPKNFFFIFFNNFSLFVIFMLCLLVKTIFFEDKCWEISKPRPFLDDPIWKKIRKIFYFVFFQ